MIELPGLVERIHETDQLGRWPQYATLWHFRAVPYDSNFGSGRLVVALRLNARLRPFANITAVKGEIQGSLSLKLAA
jgi:hypothetical protein